MARAQLVPASLVGAALAIAGCGRLGFDPDGPIPGDAATDGLDADTTGCGLPVTTTGSIETTISGASGAEGSCGGAGSPELVFTFDVPGGAEVWLISDDPVVATNTVVYLTDRCPPSADLGCDLDNGSDNGGMINATLPAGRYVAYVDGETATSTLDVHAQLEVLLPTAAACTGVPSYWRCGPELACAAGICTAPACPAPDGIFNTSATTYSATSSTVAATNRHGSSCGPHGNGGKLAPERYYQLVLPSAVANVHVSTDFAQTDYDTLIYVRSTCRDSEIACNDDNVNGVASELDTGPLAAGTYHLFVDGFSYRTGSFRVDLTITP